MKEYIERAAVKDEILSWAVCINHPDRIIRKPRWTEQEVEEAKALARAFSPDFKVYRKDNLHLLIGGGICINTDTFPSVKIGQSVTLDEIIGGAQ